MKLTKAKLARLVSEVLDLPYHRRHGKAHDIVTTIIQTMVRALQEGKSIRINGLGTFEVYERPATRKFVYFFSHFNTKGHGELQNLPPKKRVVFKPTKGVRHDY